VQWFRCKPDKTCRPTTTNRKWRTDKWTTVDKVEASTVHTPSANVADTAARCWTPTRTDQKNIMSLQQKWLWLQMWHLQRLCTVTCNNSIVKALWVKASTLKTLKAPFERDFVPVAMTEHPRVTVRFLSYSCAQTRFSDRKRLRDKQIQVPVSAFRWDMVWHSAVWEALIVVLHFINIQAVYY